MIIVLMGPSGSGKSTIGIALAASLDWRFLDADTLHSPENVARMQRGEALTDTLRAPWLRAVANVIAEAAGRDEPLVVACSALRARYRQALRLQGEPSDAVRFVYLDVPPDELARRLETRTGHFAPAAILPTQLNAWEPPGPEEHDTVSVDGSQSPTEIVAAIRRVLRL